jgi:hypothetical protein
MNFMEPEVSLQFTHESTTGFYTKPRECSQHPSNPPFQDSF